MQMRFAAQQRLRVKGDAGRADIQPRTALIRERNARGADLARDCKRELFDHEPRHQATREPGQRRRTAAPLHPGQHATDDQGQA